MLLVLAAVLATALLAWPRALATPPAPETAALAQALPALPQAPGGALSEPSEVYFTVGGYDVRSGDLWTVAIAACCSTACGLVGCYLVLRRMSLLGDAISHAILPGLALAFMFTHSRDPASMLLGALVVGVLTAVLSTGLNRWGRVPEDAAMGVVFTTLFAIGVVLITRVARDVDLDPGCVLYGLIEFAPFDTVRLAGATIPRSFVWLAAILAVNTTLIVVFYKELKIVCFDPFLATTMGISATLVHYTLMTAVAGTAVASFESVGSILVVAMLVAPGATAHLLTDRLSRMLWLSALLASLSAVLGYILSVRLNTSIAGCIATVSLALFVTTVFVAPRHGVLARHGRRLALAVRIRREDILGLLYRWHEQAAAATAAGTPAPPPVTRSDVCTLLGDRWLARAVLALLLRTGRVRLDASAGLSLTDSGRREAGQIVRGHRLWETYLVQRAGRRPEAVHASAHAAEHYLDQRLQHDLDRDVGQSVDPHGRPIP